MSEHHEAPVHSAKLLLPVVIMGMLILMVIMKFAGGDAFVKEYQNHGAATTTNSSH